MNLFLLLLLIPPERASAAPARRLRAAFTAFAYANPPFWIAKDLRLFDDIVLAQRLQEKDMPNLSYTDSYEIFREIRAVKTPEELGRLKHCLSGWKVIEEV